MSHSDHLRRGAFTSCQLLKGALLASIVLTSGGYAHPPEFHRKKERDRQARSASAVAGAPDGDASELDRQTAYFRFELLTTYTLHCASRFQAKAIRLALDSQRFATQPKSAVPWSKLEAEWDELYRQLQQSHVVIRMRWTGSKLESIGKVPAIELSRGIVRHAIVEVVNDSDNVANLSVAVNDTKLAPDRWTVHSGRMQPFLVALNPETSTQTLRVTDGDSTFETPLPVSVVEPARLRIQLIDGDRHEPCAGRVFVEGADQEYRHGGPFLENKTFTEKPLLLSAAPRSWKVPFFYGDGVVELLTPPGATKVTVERGFEHDAASENVVLKSGETREITLATKRFLDLKSLGWISGDTHIHWVTSAWNVDLPLEQLALVQRAEDLRVANNLTLLHRTATDAFVKPSQAPVGPIAKWSDDDYHMEMAEEYRNQNLYGHLCFLNLKWLVPPIGTGPQIAGDDSLDYPLNKTAILQAREQGGISIEAHGTGANHELALNAVHGLTDSLDQIDPDDYYRFLDCGFQLPLTNGSDHPARVVGCARAYVQVDGRFSYEKWIDGIRRGRTFTTSGPLLLLTVNKQTPGAVLLPAAADELCIRVKAHSRFPLGKVQIVSNGRILKELETEDQTAELEVTIPAEESRWIVARCSRTDQWNAIWQSDVAHTSAVYVHVDGRPVFRESAAREWIERMRLHIRDIKTKGVFGNRSQRNEALAYVDESIRRYERLIAPPPQPTSEEAAFSRMLDQLLMLSGFTTVGANDADVAADLGRAVHAGDLRTSIEPLVLLRVHINPESRVKIAAATAPPPLTADRTCRFLLEVKNEAGITAPLRLSVYDQSTTPESRPEWCDLRIVDNLVSSSRLTGSELEWKLVELRCSANGRREIRVYADAGQGTQDLGFRASADLLLKCETR